MRRFGLLYIAPTLLLLFGAMWPLISGEKTLYLRDVLTSHYPLKAAQAQAFQEGELPLIDPLRAGGQPLLGNPNALPLYPDNVLYVLASPLWALNAHFWIHLLLAPLAFYWLGRAWGLRRPAAWAAAVCYASSGFFLSLLNLYNLVAGAALAPAFLAACLEVWSGRGRWTWFAAALLWTLLLLAGDPMFAGLALLAALGAGFLHQHAGPRQPWRLSATLAYGTALAAPMLVEFVRILPLSLRGYRGYSSESALLQSWDPRSAVEWLLPLFFGPPDFSFWGQRFYDGLPPLLYSFYPGLLALLLVSLTSPRHGRAALWGWLLVGAGLLAALGRWNPVMRGLYEIPGMAALRYPVKMWLWVALGAALLCGAGFERLLYADGRRRALRRLGGLAALFLAAWALFSFTAPGGPIAQAHQLRWAGLSLLSLLLLALLGTALALVRARPELAGALLLLLHLGGQLFFLRPLFDADEVEPYLERPELLAEIPEGARIVHGGLRDLFGPQRLHRDALPFPDARTHWLAREHFAQLYPFSGIAWGRRYDFNPSPEGLDSFFTFSLTQILPRMSDLERLRILAASGVEVLLLDRPLELPGTQADPPARLLAHRPQSIGELHAYQLSGTAAQVQLVARVHRAPQMNAALALLTRPAFDPRSEVVLPGDGPSELLRPAGESAGRAEVLHETADEIVVQADASTAGVLLVQRTFHEIYRATVDRRPVPIEVANLHRMAVEIPPGPHRVHIWADRGPTRLSWVAALLGLAGLLVFARRDS